MEGGRNGDKGGEEVRKRGTSAEMEHWNRDYWSGRCGHEDQFITLEGELDKTRELRRLRDAQGSGGGTEAEENFVGGSERKATVRQVADIRGHMGLIAKERADLGRARNSGETVHRGKFSETGHFACVSLRSALSPADNG